MAFFTFDRNHPDSDSHYVRMNPPTEKPVSATIPFWSESNTPDKHPDWELAAENMRRQRRRPS